MYIHISTMAHVFFFEVPTPDGYRSPVRRTYTAQANEGECVSPTRPHYAFRVRVQMWTRLFREAHFGLPVVMLASVKRRVLNNRNKFQLRCN